MNVCVSSALYLPEADFKWLLGVYMQDGAETARLTAKTRFPYMSPKMLSDTINCLQEAAK
jgi:hypothetical protein